MRTTVCNRKSEVTVKIGVILIGLAAHPCYRQTYWNMSVHVDSHVCHCLHACTCSHRIFVINFVIFFPAEITWLLKVTRVFFHMFLGFFAAARAQRCQWKIALVPWTVNDAVLVIHQIGLKQRWHVSRARQSLEHNRAQEVRDMSFISAEHLWRDCWK